MENIHGIPIIYSQHTGESSPVEVPRSWGDRFFSLPWRPWIRTKVEMRFVPGVYIIDVLSGNIYGPGLHTKKLVWAHPSFKDNIEEEIQTCLNYREIKPNAPIR